MASDFDPVARVVASAAARVVAEANDYDLAVDPLFGGALGRFFGSLLGAERGWSRFWSVDDAHVERVSVAGQDVDLSGVFVSGDERRQWIQPFRATLRPDQSGFVLAAYRVCLADADVALDQVVFGERRPRTWPDPKRWAFTFAEGDMAAPVG